MPQAALNHTENPCKVIPFPKQKFCFAQMESTEGTAIFDQMTEQNESKTHKGMNNFPIDVYNQMIEYSLNNGKIRNAMLMICMANWGMRFSDVVRVRFGHLFDSEGRFKESFSLPNGEKKTNKQVIYYNNEATEAIISLYLRQPINSRKTRLDFLFTSESGNALKKNVQQIEADDLYNPQDYVTVNEETPILNLRMMLPDGVTWQPKLTTRGLLYIGETLAGGIEQLAVSKDLDTLGKAATNLSVELYGGDFSYTSMGHESGTQVIAEFYTENADTHIVHYILNVGNECYDVWTDTAVISEKDAWDIAQSCQY